MNRKVLYGIIGFVFGVIAGGFLGLVAGGTFLGGLGIHEATGLEGYELAAYIGAVAGGIALAIAGVKFAEKK